jgi:hypothetical protein
MPDAIERTYPEAGSYTTWYAGKAGVTEGDIVRESMPGDDDIRGVIGKAAPGGVSPAGDFDNYTPIHKVDNPTDGINDGVDYVVYFEDADNNLWKATNADSSTLTQLESCAEFDLCSPFRL